LRKFLIEREKVNPKLLPSRKWALPIRPAQPNTRISIVAAAPPEIDYPETSILRQV
jgi:hypothetical protein